MKLKCCTCGGLCIPPQMSRAFVVSLDNLYWFLRVSCPLPKRDIIYSFQRKGSFPRSSTNEWFHKKFGVVVLMPASQIWKSSPSCSRENQGLGGFLLLIETWWLLGSPLQAPPGDEFSPHVFLEDIYDGELIQGMNQGGLGVLTDGQFGEPITFSKHSIKKGK